MIACMFAYSPCAHSRYGAFGYKDQLPWGHCKEDMQNFSMVTKNFEVLVMSAGTFASLPSTLKDRVCLVVTETLKDRKPVKAKNGDNPDAYISINSVLGLDSACIIGGAKLIQSFADSYDVVFCTEIRTTEPVPVDYYIDLSFLVNYKESYSITTTIHDNPKFEKIIHSKMVPV